MSVGFWVGEGGLVGSPDRKLKPENPEDTKILRHGEEGGRTGGGELKIWEAKAQRQSLSKWGKQRVTQGQCRLQSLMGEGVGMGVGLSLLRDRRVDRQFHPATPKLPPDCRSVPGTGSLTSCL